MFQQAVNELEEEHYLAPIQALAKITQEFEKFMKNKKLKKCIVELKFIHDTDVLTEEDDDDPMIKVIIDPRSRSTRREHRQARHRRCWDPSLDKDPETDDDPKTKTKRPVTPPVTTTTKGRKYCAMRTYPRRQPQ